MYTPSVGYQSTPYLHQHQVPVTRHLASYNLGVSPVNRPFDSPQVGSPQIIQSRYIDGAQSPAGLTPQGSVFGANRPQSVQYGQYGQSPVSVQSQLINSPYNSGVYNPQMKYIGGTQGSIAQQGTVAGQGSITPGSIANTQGGPSAVQQNLVQSQQQIQQQGLQQSSAIQQQQDIAVTNQFTAGSAANKTPVGLGASPSVDINSAANYENANFKGGDFYRNGPNQFTRVPYDHAERDYYDQDLTQTRRRNPGKIVGPHIYSYDDSEDFRVRKPPDQEHEQKIQKLKSEKTKRELHVQELDYKIHILEQENQSLRNQMDQMKTDYKRLAQVYEEKYSHEIERLHLENQDYENSNKQWATRFKDLVDKCDDLVQEKQDLEEQNRKLNDKILQIQVLLHEQPIKNQMRFESTNKNF
ncbi:hypothetical protein TTHERM_01060800 (macronuclear) [Tetrahymena thermophila SB210]|uniref:Uncharacterized protein n=1 Tax=Tetrahymena thermophila (strain SB210) TaxID=312017 RepID=Q22KW8_TETTS|nr:hypothetical protein TTHERM_01060800 [Tetrahymena thermophila SB210]EAR85910.2 hypothetical protein TTHERM_01060800 [Tetrahymena thermophila SB210]|eukprot:XP_976505.2 hypothetical protein TTHERM_01060800 [Tetrahymena thermophila SB210]